MDDNPSFDGTSPIKPTYKWGYKPSTNGHKPPSTWIKKGVAATLNKEDQNPHLSSFITILDHG